MTEKPIVFDARTDSLENFKKKYAVSAVLDTYLVQLKELFLIRRPHYRFNPDYEKEWQEYLKDYCTIDPIEQCGSWFYFPWSRCLAHYLPEEMHNELRTARNCNIINKEEQVKLLNTTVAIAGLSVGSHSALTLAMMGIAKNFRLADLDEISGSNLNRIRADVTQIGVNKCVLVTQQIYQINPYSKIESYPHGIDDGSMKKFLSGADILVEEVDNLAIKIQLRVQAKLLGIPVVMATDNGDNVIVDVERYDLNPDLVIFNGVAGNLTLEEFKQFSPAELPRLATKIAGPKLITPRMQDSLLAVGHTIYSWPQTGNAATLAGVGIAYVAKRILLKEKIKEGKMEINLDAIFDPEYNDPAVVKDREEKRGNFLKSINLESYD